MNDLFPGQSDKIESLDRHQLEKIESYLELVLLALKAIANIDSEVIVKAAKDLDLNEIVTERIAVWQSNSSSIDGTVESVPRLNVEEVRWLAIVICYLARQNRELLRRAVSLLEQAIEENSPPYQTALLGNYIDRFVKYRKDSALAWKLLIDLLFYSGKNGQRWLWFAMLDA